MDGYNQITQKPIYFMRENINPNQESSTSQTALILAHLSQGKAITPLEALAKFGCLRLSARIWDLRDKGYDIKTRIVTTSTNKNVAEYYLDR